MPWRHWLPWYYLSRLDMTSPGWGPDKVRLFTGTTHRQTSAGTGSTSKPTCLVRFAFPKDQDLHQKIKPQPVLGAWSWTEIKVLDFEVVARRPLCCRSRTFGFYSTLGVSQLLLQMHNLQTWWFICSWAKQIKCLGSVRRLCVNWELLLETALRLGTLRKLQVNMSAPFLPQGIIASQLATSVRENIIRSGS